MERYHPAHSAPDLSELLEARSSAELHEQDRLEDRHSPWTSSTSDLAATSDHDQEDDHHHHHQLPTPAASRSPTPDLGYERTPRGRSDSPEAFLREGSAFTDDRNDLTLQEHDHDQSCGPSSPGGLSSEHGRSVPPSRVGYEGDHGSTTSPMSSSFLAGSLPTRLLPASLWDYLNEELRATDLDGSQEMKAERVTNFFSVPIEVEKIMLFGLFVCLDSFLYTFTILPLRFMVALHRLSSGYLKPGKRISLPVSAKCDLAKFSIFIITCIALHRITDASKMYHSVRGQEVIKLYVIFNVLEIADRLCCSFGQDLLDSLCSRSTLGRREDGSRPHIRPAGLFALCTLYTIAHTMVLFYSLVSLNVAINSYDNALLTLLISNQFVEIKGAVFKKFEKENLFQMTCADIVERFQLGLMLSIVALRNLIELSGSTFSLLPTSFIPVLPSFSILQSIFSPALIVIASEMLVDWLKHAFITKFNHIRPAVYGRFIDVLCRDLTSGSSSLATTAFADQSPSLARRLGFAALPLGCLVVRVIFQTIEILADTSHIDECAPPPRRLAVSKGFLGYLSLGPEGQARLISWLLWTLIVCVLWSCLVILKLLIGINLRAYAVSRYSSMGEREQEDQLNDRSRIAIGTNAAERAQEGDIKRMIEKKDYDSPGKFSGKIQTNSGNGVSMENLSRFSMIKSRIY